ncbi:type II TA system antitoxin MqsA family protein [Alkalilimnicola ehrlichii]|uniref:type II TA system antitoxin MqsA family protein n=1 Tax=Alkalilimnicola ehrlichii TaxID=351052 RepID=UPI003B9EE9F3
MEHCIICGSAHLERERVTHHATEFGVGSVYFLNTPVIRCRDCGDEAVAIPHYRRVARQIRDRLCALNRVLKGDEFALLRRELGLTGTELARRLGVHAVTVSRWEQGHSPVSQSADRLLRSWTLAALGYAWPEMDRLLGSLPEGGIDTVEIDLATGPDGEWWMETHYRFGGTNTAWKMVR